MLALQRKEDDLGFRFLRIKKAREGIAPGPRLQQKHSPHSCRGMGVGLRFGDRAVGSEIIFFFHLLVSTSQRNASDQNEVCKRDQRISELGRH